MRAGSDGISRDGRLRAGGNNYITALLLIEPGRTASDGLEAPTRHHGVCMCWCMYIYHCRFRERSHNFGWRV